MTRHMLVLDLCCPQCGASLTEGTELRLDAYVKDTHQEGPVSLSAVFGDYSLDTDLDIPDGTTVDFRCPRCEASLMLPVQCRICSAPMASLNLKVGGYLEFCSRRGCKAHALGGVGNIDDLMSLVNKMFGTPYG